MSEQMTKEVEVEGKKKVLHIRVTTVPSIYLVDYGVGINLLQAEHPDEVAFGRELTLYDLIHEDVKVDDDPYADPEDPDYKKPKRYNLHIVVEAEEIEEQEDEDDWKNQDHMA